VNVLFAGVFGGNFDVVAFIFEGTAAGGGIESSGPGSLNTENPPLDFPEGLAEVETEATRLDFPACRKVVPAIFLTSGTFSLILVFRVPRSCHVSEDVGDGPSVFEEPVGSRKIWREELEADMGVDTLCAEVAELESLREVVVSAARGFCNELMGGAGGRIKLLIMRF
jgi:hypothetical protein